MFSFLLIGIFCECFWALQNVECNSVSYNNDWCLQYTYYNICNGNISGVVKNKNQFKKWKHIIGRDILIEEGLYCTYLIVNTFLKIVDKLNSTNMYCKTIAM